MQYTHQLRQGLGGGVSQTGGCGWDRGGGGLGPVYMYVITCVLLCTQGYPPPSIFTGDHSHTLLDRDQPEWTLAMAGQSPDTDGLSRWQHSIQLLKPASKQAHQALPILDLLSLSRMMYIIICFNTFLT